VGLAGIGSGSDDVGAGAAYTALCAETGADDLVGQACSDSQLRRRLVWQSRSGMQHIREPVTLDGTYLFGDANRCQVDGFLSGWPGREYGPDGDLPREVAVGNLNLPLRASDFGEEVGWLWYGMPGVAIIGSFALHLEVWKSVMLLSHSRTALDLVISSLGSTQAITQPSAFSIQGIVFLGIGGLAAFTWGLIQLTNYRNLAKRYEQNVQWYFAQHQWLGEYRVRPAKHPYQVMGAVFMLFGILFITVSVIGIVKHL
jgi:hypothetical protein